MLDQQQLMKDMYCVKALCYMEEGGGIKWYRCSLLGENQLGQYHVRRLRTGEEGITSQLRNLTPQDRKFIRDNYL